MFISLFAIFVILCGRFGTDMGTLEILIFGAIVCGLVYLFLWRAFGITPKREIHFVRDVFWLFVYVPVLLWEVISSNFSLMKIILSKKAVYNPAIVKIKVPLKRNITRVILANSITLTPGTITVDLNEDGYTVHCLDKSMSEGIENGVFVKMLRKIDG